MKRLSLPQSEPLSQFEPESEQTFIYCVSQKKNICTMCIPLKKMCASHVYRHAFVVIIQRMPDSGSESDCETDEELFSKRPARREMSPRHLR